VARLDAYLDRVTSGVGAVQGIEELDAWGREQERLMLGLRRTAGVILGRGGAALLRDPWGMRLVEAGVLTSDGERLRLARPLLGDEAVRAVLALSPSEC
jgi:hypothetical protein